MATDPRAGTAGLSNVHIEGRTDGLFLTLMFEQRYVNNSAAPVEIIYSFPMPCNAVMLGVEAEIHGRAMKVAYRERAAAEEIYEMGQEKQRFIAMVGRVSAGLCSASLGSLRQGGDAMLRLRVGMFVDVVNGRGRIVVPTVANYPEGAWARAGFAGGPSRDLTAEYPLSLRLVLTDYAASATVSSPTHAVSAKVSGKTATLALSEAATLDRDVVFILDNFPEADAIQFADSRGVFGLTASTPAVVGNHHDVDLEVVLDAAGPLGAVAGGLLDILDRLVRLLHVKDQIAITRIGRTVSQLVPKGDAAAAHVALSHLPPIVADLGDVPVGHSLPALELRNGVDLLLITDGSTRVASGLCDLARTEGRRLFILAVGAAPNEGILRPAAIATTGDYAALVSGEAVEPALQKLLSAVRFNAVSSQRHLELIREFGVLWTDGPATLRPVRREAIAVEFERGPINGPTSSATAHNTDQNPPMWRQSDAIMAPDLVFAVAERRLGSLAGAEQAAWANWFGLAQAGGVWVAKASAAAPETLAPARLLILPQMIAAGWLGLGVFRKPAQMSGSFRTISRTPSTRLRVVSWRWILVIAVSSIFAGAGARIWLAVHPASPSFPLMLADYHQHRPISWALWLTIAAASAAVLAFALFWWRYRKRSGDAEDALPDTKPARPTPRPSRKKPKKCAGASDWFAAWEAVPIEDGMRSRLYDSKKPARDSRCTSISVLIKPKRNAYDAL